MSATSRTSNFVVTIELTKFMMKYFNVLCVMILTSGIVQGSNRFLMCKQVEDIFSPHDQIISQGQGRIQGAPGKRGAPGIPGGQGPIGPQGDPGVVDYEQINSTLERLVDPVIQELEEMKAAMNQMNSTLDKLKEDVSIPMQKFCDIKWKGSCFWAVSHKTRDVTYSQGEAICAQNHAVIAFPRNEVHYDMILGYLRSMIREGETVVRVWLGMKINPSTENVILSNGNSAPFVKYYPGYPSSASTHTNLVFNVKTDSTSRYQGMFNDRPSQHHHGVLCETKL